MFAKDLQYNPSLNDEKTAASTAIGSSMEHPSSRMTDDIDEFDPSIMVMSKKTISRLKVTGLEGYNSDEDLELEDDNLNTESNFFDEVDDAKRKGYSQKSKKSINSNLDIMNLAARVDLFDGRLEQFNKFLEFIAVPKHTIANKKNETIMIGKKHTALISKQTISQI